MTNNGDNVSWRLEDDEYHAVLVVTVAAFIEYHRLFISKVPCRTSPYTGNEFVREILNGHPRQCQEQLRMQNDVFLRLCQNLEDGYQLKVSRNMNTEEQVAIFLLIIGHGLSNRMIQEIFQHSGQTISYHLHNVIMNAAIRMSMNVIKVPEQHAPFPRRARTNPKFWPHFKNCIGAIDGTHISVCFPESEMIPYIGRKGYPTQNIMAACGFDICFTFAWPGWEGSAHDTRIFHVAINDPTIRFPLPNDGEFYLVDSGYPNMKGYLAPFKGQRYHIPEFMNGVPPNNVQEQFNHIHSSLRNVIERTFGVWKARWKILANMPKYAFETQIGIVSLSMAIHNFIRRYSIVDEQFKEYDNNLDFVPPTDPDVRTHPETQYDNDEGAMDMFRNDLARRIANS